MQIVAGGSDDTISFSTLASSPHSTGTGITRGSSRCRKLQEREKHRAFPAVRRCKGEFCDHLSSPDNTAQKSLDTHHLLPWLSVKTAHLVTARRCLRFV
nr:hypothetical protein CFP56_30769 [Quercus suber]